jgi:hypothetical protein
MGYVEFQRSYRWEGLVGCRLVSLELFCLCLCICSTLSVSKSHVLQQIDGSSLGRVLTPAFVAATPCTGRVCVRTSWRCRRSEASGTACCETRWPSGTCRSVSQPVSQSVTRLWQGSLFHSNKSTLVPHWTPPEAGQALQVPCRMWLHDKHAYKADSSQRLPWPPQTCRSALKTWRRQRSRPLACIGGECVHKHQSCCALIFLQQSQSGTESGDTQTAVGLSTDQQLGNPHLCSLA